ncbi:hydrogenase maturation protease [Sorangium sp. So ce1036]|uniref:hydrogenase maturation protease n=1 Tax=Sorangium sp. So ce1036 TaxID=3133328 RepID=UPI003F058385
MSGGPLVIALGNEAAGDDGAALAAARALAQDGGVDVVLAGRPGVALLDLLDAARPVVLLDVVRAGGAPGAIVSLGLGEALDRAAPGPHVSSHGFGPAEALELARALGRPLPRGILVGIEGARFTAGAPHSDAVAQGIPALIEAARAAVAALRRESCTSTG